MGTIYYHSYTVLYFFHFNCTTYFPMDIDHATSWLASILYFMGMKVSPISWVDTVHTVPPSRYKLVVVIPSHYKICNIVLVTIISIVTIIRIVIMVTIKF